MQEEDRVKRYLKRIMEKAGLEKEEVLQLVKEKKEELRGIVNDEGALLIISLELRIDTEDISGDILPKDIKAEEFPPFHEVKEIFQFEEEHQVSVKYSCEYGIYEELPNGTRMVEIHCRFHDYFPVSNPDADQLDRHRSGQVALVQEEAWVIPKNKQGNYTHEFYSVKDIRYIESGLGGYRIIKGFETSAQIKKREISNEELQEMVKKYTKDLVSIMLRPLIKIEPFEYAPGEKIIADTKPKNFYDKKRTL